MPRTRKPLVALALPLLLCLGCAVAPTPRSARSAALVRSAQTFTHALRWQRFRQCGRYVAPEIQEVFRQRIVDAEDSLRITDTELIDVDWPEDSIAATIVVKMRWIELPSVVERSATVEQRWEDRTQEGWLLSKMEVTGGRGDAPLDIL